MIAALGLLKRRPRFCLSTLWHPVFVADRECRAARSPDSVSRLLARPDAGFRVIGVLYQEFVVRCRTEGLASVVPDLP
ncbi:MAG: ATP-binding protein, partial [Mesorhizobium sp.]